MWFSHPSVGYYVIREGIISLLSTLTAWEVRVAKNVPLRTMIRRYRVS